MSHLTPYLCVADSRAAMDWYAEVFQATVKGKPYIMDDGRIGHVELTIGDSLLMMADAFPRGERRASRPQEGQCRVVAFGGARLRRRGRSGRSERGSSGSRPRIDQLWSIGHLPRPFWTSVDRQLLRSSWANSG
jgi:hypothetical protein